ncbi:DsrE family protein [Igneacidithiobacillus siniensis]|uniref:DsrE family protein n=1 Tax=Acidithiobacillus TaxID=119977 RepID=UPI00200CB9C8|nr:DsrE family protein [Gammaproteobacteria bacterium]
MKLFRIVVSTLVLLLSLSSYAAATTLSDAQALSGLHSAKAVFLVNINNPMAVDHLVRVIGLTRKQFLQQHVTPHFIVVFIGPDVAFLTKDRRGISYMDERPIADLQKEIGNLSKLGIEFQACGVAMHGMDVQPNSLIPDVHPVESGFISVIAYQEKGYALVPVY